MAEEPTIEVLHRDLALLRDGFRAEPYPERAVRERRLRRLRELVLHNQRAFCDAISADFGCRSPYETLAAEIMLVDQTIGYLLDHLAGWMRPEPRRVGPLFFPASAEVRYQPKGVVGVISPWNYPVQLALVPLATALAAGNRVYLKPSELVPRTSALTRRLLHDAFGPDLVRVVEGGPDVGRAFSGLPFDHLLFTGSTAVGRAVMRAAAEHLTPVTLELGGKSPAIVHRGARLPYAAERILYGKTFNAGQTCIAVDHVYVPRDLEARFVDLLLEQLRRFYGERVAANPDYGSIVSPRHRARLLALLEDAERRGARVIRYDPGGEDFEAVGKVPPTLVLQVDDGMALMQEEIFGPILPIVPYDSIDEVLDQIAAGPRPLALYYFDTDPARIERVLRLTHAGGVCINDTLLHSAQDDLPFGGIGASGMGAYHGREGFLTFSHAKAVFRQRRVRFTSLFNPPYGRVIRTMLRGLLGAGGEAGTHAVGSVPDPETRC